jgi:hypothetical protein
MKALIKNVKWIKEYDDKFGTKQLFKIEYDDKTGWYSSKSKDQKKFVTGQECEFTETFSKGREGQEVIYVKPIYNAGQSNFGRALKREQSKYSGFAVSYAKDLCIADKIKFEELEMYATVLFNLMVELDKSIEQ